MDFVLDENVSFGLAEELKASGHEVISVVERTKRGATDEEIFNLTKFHKAVLITRDYHFTNPIRFPTKDTKGIIYIRHGNLTSKEEIKLIKKFLESHSPDLFEGKLVLVSKKTVRLR